MPISTSVACISVTASRRGMAKLVATTSTSQALRRWPSSSSSFSTALLQGR